MSLKPSSYANINELLTSLHTFSRSPHGLKFKALYVLSDLDGVVSSSGEDPFTKEVSELNADKTARYLRSDRYSAYLPNTPTYVLVYKGAALAYIDYSGSLHVRPDMTREQAGKWEKVTKGMTAAAETFKWLVETIPGYHV